MTSDELFNKANEAYEHGDYTLAFELFEKAALLGDVSAMERLAVLYDTGEGVQVDSDKSIYWDSQAISHGSVVSLFNLAETYRKLGNTREAKKCYEECLKHDDGEAALQLAKMYLVSEKECETVKMYLNMAMTSGNAFDSTLEEARILLGELTQQG